MYRALFYRYKEENEMLGGSDKRGQVEDDGRETLDTRMWATHIIKDTPHGFMAKIMTKRTVSADPKPQFFEGTSRSTHNELILF